MKSVFLRENKNRDYLRDQKADFFAGRGAAALGGVGRGALPSLGGTQKKRGCFLRRVPPKLGRGSFPSGSPRATSGRCQGPAPSPAPAAPGRFLALSPQTCGDFGGKEGGTKVPGKCPPFPADVESPHGRVFLAPRPPRTLLARSPRKDGRAVPPSTKTRRGHGGDICGATLGSGRAARRGNPAGGDPQCRLRARGGGLCPQPPGRGCGAPRERWSTHTPPPLCCTHTHACAGHGDRPWDTGTRVGTRGDGTRVCGHAQRSRTRPCPHTDTEPRLAPVVCKCAPARLREPWGSPIQGTHSSAPSLPKFVGFVAPSPHSTQPAQLRAAAGAGLQEEAAESPPPASFPARGERTQEKR